MTQTKHAIAITGQDLALWSEILLHLAAEALRPDAPAKQWKAAAACFFANLRRSQTKTKITIVEHRPSE